MPPPNKVLMPDNLDKELGDLRRRVLGLETAGSAAVPWGPYDQSIDAAHPMDLAFPMSNGVKPAIARLSFHLQAYRTTSSFAGGATGAGSSHGHTSAAHSHSHAHTEASHSHLNAPTVGSGGAALSINGTTLNMASGPNTGWNTNGAAGAGTGTDATSTTPGATGNEASHTHSIGASSLGVSEGSSTTVSAIAVDGVDKTSILGGPWAGDVVDLDLTGVLPMGDGAWHKVTLTTAGQGRIFAVLKLST